MQTLRDKMRAQGKMPTPEDIKRFGGNPPLQTGTKVLVTPRRSPRMILDKVLAGKPWQGEIVSVLLIAPAYEIKRGDFVEPYIHFSNVTKL